MRKDVMAIIVLLGSLGGCAENGDSRELSTTAPAALTMAPPAAPATAPSVVANNGAATIAWAQLPFATSYTVYIDSSPSGAFSTVACSTTSASLMCVKTGLGNGRTYYFKYSASNRFGWSGLSPAASATPGEGIPYPPASLTVSPAVGSKSLSLTFRPGPGSPTGYVLYWSMSPGTPGTAIPLGNVKGYLHTGLTPGATYFYRLTATNAYGESAPLPAPPAAEIAGKPIDAPSNVVTTISSGRVTVSWSAPAGAEGCGSTVYRNSGGVISSVDVWDATSWTDAGLANDATYAYSVRAYNCVSGQYSRVSAEVLATPVAACSGARAAQAFADGMVGCAGAVSFGTSLCGAGYSACSAREWVEKRAGAAPSWNYWTSESLSWDGTGSGLCGAYSSGHNTCTFPMRVCSGAADALGNTCTWTGCGYEGNTPFSSNQFFGGACTDPTAGALCCPAGPATPGALAATTIAPDQIALTWDAPAWRYGPGSYVLRRDGVQIGGVIRDTSYIDSRLDPASTHTYTIASYHTGSESAQSAPVTATTYFCQPFSRQTCTIGTCSKGVQVCDSGGASFAECYDEGTQCPRTGCPVARTTRSQTIPADGGACTTAEAREGEWIHMRADLSDSTDSHLPPNPAYSVLYAPDWLPVAAHRAESTYQGLNAITMHWTELHYRVPAGAAGTYTACVSAPTYQVLDARWTVDVAGVETRNGASCSTLNDLCFGAKGPGCGACDFPDRNNEMKRFCPITVGSNKHDECCVHHPGGYLCGGQDKYGNSVPDEYSYAYRLCFDEFNMAFEESLTIPHWQWWDWIDGTIYRYANDPSLAISPDNLSWTLATPGPAARLAPSGTHIRMEDAQRGWCASKRYDSEYVCQ